MDACRFRSGLSRFAALSCLLGALAGCHVPWQLRSTDDVAEQDPQEKSTPEKVPTKPGETPAAADPPVELPKALSDVRWVQASALAAHEPGPAGYFWQHPALEGWAATGGDHRRVLTTALDNPVAVVAGNAAILLARTGDVAGVERLAATVGNVELPLPLRSAAAEMLAHLDQPAARAALQKLIADFSQFTGPAQAFYLPRLHAELLLQYARCSATDDNSPFLQALDSPAPEVRRAALLAWTNAERSGFPESALPLHDDPNPLVRVALLAAIAVQRPAAAQEALARALDDQDLDVRVAAVAALASLGGEPSKTSLLKFRKHTSEVMRAAVVGGLAKLGAADVVLDAADDKSWLVRQAVAESLARPTDAVAPIDQQTLSLAHTLLHDKSLGVQKCVLKSIATWPLNQAGPVLLEVMAEGGYQMRKDATRALGLRWTTAAKFPYDGAAKARATASGELRLRWSAEFGPIAQQVATEPAEPKPTAAQSAEQLEKVRALVQTLRDSRVSTSRRRESVAALVACGGALLPLVEQLDDEAQPLPAVIYEEVLPQLSPLFEAIETMHSNDTPLRRTAAAQLVVAAVGQPLGPLALRRLVELAKTESDPVVWQALLTVTARDARPQAVDLAYMAIGNGSPEVRRRACEYLAAHGDPRHVPVLLPVLADLNPSVVVVAVRGPLGAAGSIDDSKPLVQLLLTPDKHLRVEVAASLARLHVAEGPPALDRLALDADDEIARRAVAAMGQLADRIYVPMLLSLLAAPVDVQKAALASLTQITGEDFPNAADGTPNSRDQQVRRWQHWYRDTQSQAPREEQP